MLFIYCCVRDQLSSIGQQLSSNSSQAVAPLQSSSPLLISYFTVFDYSDWSEEQNKSYDDQGTRRLPLAGIMATEPSPSSAPPSSMPSSVITTPSSTPVSPSSTPPSPSSNPVQS